MRVLQMQYKEADATLKEDIGLNNYLPHGFITSIQKNFSGSTKGKKFTRNNFFVTSTHIGHN
jgi:hypothetical protein